MIDDMEADKPYRLIYSLKLNIEPPPKSGPQVSCQLIVPLTRAGMSTGRNGRQRRPKTRSIDLRIGDDVMVEGIWRKVLSIEAYREHWLTEEEAANSEHGQGYLYRVPVLESAG